MVDVIDLKMFMKAKYHFHVEIQIRQTGKGREFD